MDAAATGEFRHSLGTELLNSTMVVAKALGMLNAKNVIAEPVEPDGMAARNRKRSKRDIPCLSRAMCSSSGRVSAGRDSVEQASD